MTESQLIFTDKNMKSRLIKQGKTLSGKDWYVAEWKPNDKDSQWFPWASGTAEFLDLTPQEIAWAK